eukprot:jgi/Bigna1/146579/aug1.117_g21287
MPRFRGKRVMVTGGDSGIGLAAVHAFYQECANVMMVGHNETKTMLAAQNVTSYTPSKQFCPEPPQLHWIAANTANRTESSFVVSETVKIFGGLDIAVNNAGVAGVSTAEIGDAAFLDHFDKSLEMSVNVYGTLNCMNAQLQVFNKSGNGGVMVNVASICGESAVCGAAYTTSKFAEIGFSKQAALTYAGSGIRINILAPGPVDTPMMRDGRPEDDPSWQKDKKKVEAKVPMGRIADPWEMAGPILFLSSDESSFMTGSVVTADGGYLLR